MTDKLDSRDSIVFELVDLEQYPIHRINEPAGKGHNFLKRCQQHMEEYGWCNFVEFIKPEALNILRNEALDLLPSAQILTIRRNIYQGAVENSMDPDDLKSREYVHTAHQLADDQIPNHSAIQKLYQSTLVTDFIRQVQKKDTLYRCSDEFQALNIVALNPESWHAWHYDTIECTVTLLLQASEQGGEFTFIPNSRDDEMEDTQRVNQVLGGDLSKAETFKRDAGALTLFRGGYSLHSVTKVKGTKPRVTAIFTYSEEPHGAISDDLNIRIYGKRAENIINQRKLKKEIQ